MKQQLVVRKKLKKAGEQGKTTEKSVKSLGELEWAEQYWKSVNYLAAASVYLQDNFLLERPLRKEDIKEALLGHWGTCPGINFAYTHLNLLASQNKQSIMLVVGPGHGFAAVLANQFLEGSLKEYYPQMTHDKQGIGNVIKAFCWPGGFPSHINPGVPGCIHEGGELGYALGTAFGSVFDNPELITAVIIGDGEAETGPTATAWHSTKFLNPLEDGAVLPILHLNGYKISSPTIYSTMSDQDLKAIFTGYGYEPLFVTGDQKSMHDALNHAYKKIKEIQHGARAKGIKGEMRWPMIIMRTPKGWTTMKKLGGEEIEGSWRSHQVPAKDARQNPQSLKALEHWLRSYKPQVLFPDGRIPAETLQYVPQGEFRIGNNRNAIGGKVRVPLLLPQPVKYSVGVKKRGIELAASTSVFAQYLKDVFVLNKEAKNFRIVSPDELSSNKLDGVLAVTGRRYVWPHQKKDQMLKSDGRVMEMLSEHTLQAWLQGYVLTGRHGLFPSYEAFLPIVDSMVSQYLKFIALSQQYRWRPPVSSLNYLLTSVCWRQDHNGFSHQNPGFITTLLNKSREEKLVRLYFPADANMLLVVGDHALKSTNRVNAIIADKQMIRQWLNYDEAVEQAKTGAGVWKFASQDEPDVVLAACGDYQTQEMLACVQFLKEHVPGIRVRFVNVSELNVLGNERDYPNALDDSTFSDIFTPDKHVLFSFHGYPDAIKQLLFDRPENKRFHAYGYTERGTTTTPFDMLVRNGISRYHFAIRAIEHAAPVNRKVADKAGRIIALCKKKLAEHREYILKNGHDPEDINEWTWK